MSTINRQSVIQLEEHQNIDVYTNGVNILLKLLDNVIREPHNLKYRKIRLENASIKEKVLCLPGARELLHHIGFEEVGELRSRNYNRLLIINSYSRSQTAN